MKRKTHEMFLKELSDKNVVMSDEILKFNSEYKNMNSKIRFENRFGEMSAYPSNMLKGNICGFRGATNKHLYFIKLFKEKSPDVSKSISFVTEVESMTKRVVVRDEYGELLVIPRKLLSGQRPSILTAINRDEYLKSMFLKVHGNTYSYDKVSYEKITKNVTISCGKHGDFEQSPRTHLRGFGCPSCNNSIGENKISLILKNMNIKFEPQKKFAECIHKRMLPFDFYLEAFKCCIEYHGKQHYEEVEHFGGAKQLKLQQKLDSIKYEYCKKNSIELITISYLDFENIEEILNKHLTTNKKYAILI